VRGASAAFTANGFPIGTVRMDGVFTPEKIGVIVYDHQSVAFRWIRIAAPD
jgi:hypothetical protein